MNNEGTVLDGDDIFQMNLGVLRKFDWMLEVGYSS
jgi:hypothetical protein